MTTVIDHMRARLGGGRHWHKGAYSDGFGNYCLLGAMPAPALNLRVLDALDAVVLEQYPERCPRQGYTSLRPSAQFNDHPETEWVEVAGVLDKAEARLAEAVAS